LNHFSFAGDEMPRSPLVPHQAVSGSEPTARSTPTGSPASATGHLPAHGKVQVKTMRRSELLFKGDPSHRRPPSVKILNSLGDRRYEADFSGHNFGAVLDAHPALRHLEGAPATDKINSELAELERQEAGWKKAREGAEENLSRISVKRAELLEEMNVVQSGTTAREHPEAPRIKSELRELDKQEREAKKTMAEAEKNLPEIKSSKSEVLIRMDATRQVIEARKKTGLDSRFGRIFPSGDPYRYSASTPESTQSRNLGQGRILRDKLVQENVSHFLATAGLSGNAEAWRYGEKEMVIDAFESANYHVHTWAPGLRIDDPDSPEGLAEADKQICEEWKNGGFDNEPGATFLNFNSGHDWVVWMGHDRATGYNLSQGSHVHATPSELYRDLEKNHPATLNGLDAVFVAHPCASNALSYLKSTSQAKAHHALRSYCNAMGRSVVDMDFHEFGRFMQSHYPGAVVARYDSRSLDSDALGAALDASETSFLLLNLTGNSPFSLQGKTISCFNRPGLKLSPNEERMKKADESDAGAPSAPKTAVGHGGQTPQQILQLRRNSLFKRAADAVDTQSSAKPVRSMVAGESSKRYDPSDYSGNPQQYENPSAVLRRYAEKDGQIGIVSVGDLRTSFSPDDATLAQIAESEQVKTLKDWFAFSGVSVESPAELARFVYKSHGVWTEMDAESMKRFVEHQNDTLPDNKKIAATLEVIREGQDLPNPGEDPKGHLIQFSWGGKPVNVAFYKRGEHTVFQGPGGNEYLSAHLNAVARYEGWQREGPVSILRFGGPSVLPLVAVGAAAQEEAQEAGDADERKRKRRPVSTSSAISDIAMRPRPSKTERLDSDASDE
jgi:hypothetical protein